MKRRGQEALRPEWAVADGDQRDAAIVYPGTGRPGTARDLVFMSGRGKFGRYLKRAGDSPATCGRSAATTRSRSSATCCGCCPAKAPACSPRPSTPGGAVPAATGSARPRSYGGRATARAAAMTRCPAPSAAPLRPRVNPYFVRLYREVAQTLSGLVAREHTAQVHPRPAPPARGRVPRRRAEAAVLLADDGAWRRHRRPQRRLHAERPAHARELRAALRPRRPVRAARPGHHLLRHRQQPRPVLLPQLRQDGLGRRHPAAPRPAQRGPAPLPRPRDLARRGRHPPGPGDPRVHRHGRHRAGGQAAARPAPARSSTR